MIGQAVIAFFIGFASAGVIDEMARSPARLSKAVFLRVCTDSYFHKYGKSPYVGYYLQIFT